MGQSQPLAMVTTLRQARVAISNVNHELAHNNNSLTERVPTTEFFKISDGVDTVYQVNAPRAGMLKDTS